MLSQVSLCHHLLVKDSLLALNLVHLITINITITITIMTMKYLLV